MSSRGYQSHDMIIVSESKYSWGGTDYSLLALKSGTTIPTGLSTSNSTGISRNNLPSITDATFTKSFIIPTVFDAVSIIDGTIEGTIKLTAYSAVSGGSAGNYIDITKAELEIKAIDTTGSSRTLQSLIEIWSGSVKSTKEGTISKQFMYWIDVEDLVVIGEERIVLDYTVTYSTSTAFSNDEFSAYIYCTPDTDETTITLPFVM